MEHPNLFGLAKELGIAVPSEYYSYQVENLPESLTLTSCSIDVLKLAIVKVFENKHDKRLTIKRKWTIHFREKKEEEVNVSIGIFDNEDGDY